MTSCPVPVTAIAPSAGQVGNAALTYLSYDPNYADDDGDQMDDDDDDEADEVEAEDYSDDDDVSWKVLTSLLFAAPAAVLFRAATLVAYCGLHAISNAGAACGGESPLGAPPFTSRPAA